MTVSETPDTQARLAAPVQKYALLVGLVAIFVLSGASGLIYQVVWMRMLSLVFGVTAYAVSTVLSSFFLGLGLGSLLAGRLADRLRSPLRAYAGAEVLVAAAALLTPAAFALARALYVSIHAHLPVEGLWPLTVVRLVLAFLVLLVPTTLMGATLPLIVRSSLMRSTAFTPNLSLLYAANTFGAMAGAALASFELIGRYGLRGSLLIAAGGNLLAAAGAVALSYRRVMDAPAPAEPDDTVDDAPWGVLAARAAVVGIGVSGAVSLAYEVVWARVLALFFDATVYGFTAMLAMVLLGIGLGSWLVSLVIARRWPWPLVFAAIEAGVGVLALATVPLLTRVIPLAERLGLYADPGPLGQFSIEFMVFAAAVVVLPPMLLLGASFPVAMRIVGAGSSVGRRVGGVYAVNVFGGILGALLAGFILLPRLGVEATLLLLAYINLALAVALVGSASGTRRWALPAAAAAAVAVVAIGGVIAAPDLLTGIFRNRLTGQDVVWVEEGLENMVIVTDNRATGERKMYINGQPQASTVSLIANFHRLIGHLPMLLHPAPTRALVVGLGGGATSGALASHSGTEVEVVELSSAVVQAAPLFEEINGGVLNRPNVRLRVDDGRNVLLLSDGGYDVITADVIRPGHAGAGAVYSKEYFQLAREALAEDGIMLQWLEQLSEERYKLMLRTFVEVFPYVTLWADGALLAGSKRPLALDRTTLERRLADGSARSSLALTGLNTPDDVLRLYTGDRDEALQYLAGESRAVSDDRPYVEFNRSLRHSRRQPNLSGFSRDPRRILKDR